nr:G-protein coupled receptor Mth2-like isoform X1 [Megalopta genalis]XP_033323121.1 G-protein coupled receptor Mth2-like isoform X2 [Megalopta genalis]XP_033323122.1 G-protein coupled receptor Mth2-like isoform X2 [Megalopta genalis]
MPGNTKSLLVLMHILLWDLAVCYDRVKDETPTIYWIPRENGTAIPEEYKNLPLVSKCCPDGEVFIKNGTNTAACGVIHSTTEYNFSPIFYNFNKSGYEIPGDEHSTFVAITGDPCKYKRYMLDPDETSDDNSYLLVNGSVFAPHHEPSMLMPAVDYCMEIVPEIGLKTFVCFPEERLIVAADSRYTFYTCGLLISVPFLILTIAAYTITPQLRDVYGKALCRYCGCLALAFSTLAITQLGSAHLSDQACTSIAFVIQFSFVACFFWLNAMCIEMWSLVRSHVKRETNRMKAETLFFWYSLWCWGPPVILILVSMIMDLSPTIPATYVKPKISKESCWFESSDEAMPYFYVPVGLLLLGNVTLFILTFIKLSKYQKDLDLRRLARNEETDRQDRSLLRRYTRMAIVSLIIFFLIGLNWTMELISWFIDADSFDWSMLDLVNALQGVLVFGLFVIRRPQRDFVWHRIQQLRGIDTTPPQAGSMELYLLPMLNGDTVPGQTIIP